VSPIDAMNTAANPPKAQSPVFNGFSDTGLARGAIGVERADRPFTDVLTSSAGQAWPEGQPAVPGPGTQCQPPLATGIAGEGLFPMRRAQTVSAHGVIGSPRRRQSRAGASDMARDLREALRKGALTLHYQPLIEAGSHRLAGFEALVRWTHPIHGEVSPTVFIALAERTGLIAALGRWVLRTACAAAAQWPPHLRIAVNLSPVQLLTGALAEEVEATLRASGLAAERLELEITESVLLPDSEHTLTLLHRLNALGVHISADDFGTGYASLSYLRRFPFDRIKIDQSFVRDLAHHTGSLEIVRAVLGLGRALGMRMLAEGVETAEQMEILESEGCHELQGYLFSRPVAADQVAELIARDTRRREPANVAVAA
jgi:EAL domain-containing protein (putative c-di-GMP-specific phosphodiesterase class I)